MSSITESPAAPVKHETGEGSTERTRLLKNGGVLPVNTVEPSAPLKVRTYRVRWFVLLVFWLHMLTNNWIWISFGSIADLAACYYDVSLFGINTLSWVFMLVYLLGFVPTIWFLNRYGLKVTGAVAACANAVGAWLRFAGTGPEYFWLVLTGNTVASVGNLLEWGAGSYLAGIWFPPGERAFATAAISSQGEQFGVFLGLVLSPIFIHSSNTEAICGLKETESQAYYDWQVTIQSQLFYYLLAQAIFATVLLLPTLLCLPSDPKSPPSLSTELRGIEEAPLLKSTVSLCRNPYFLLYMIVFGIFVAGAGSFVTMFDEILYTEYTSLNQEYVLYLGAAMQMFSVIGVVAISKWIDYTKSFYCATLTVCIASSLAAMTFAVFIQLHVNFFIVCLPVILTRALLVTFQGVGFEYGAEITYPLPESFSSCILNGASQLCSIILIIVPTVLLESSLTTYSSWFFAAVFLVGVFVMVFVHPRLKRVEVDLMETEVCWNCCWFHFYRQRLKT